jgi:hypothetical protein
MVFKEIAGACWDDTEYRAASSKLYMLLSQTQLHKPFEGLIDRAA